MALRADPQAIELVDRLYDLAEELDRWPEYADTLMAVADMGIDASQAREYDVRQAGIAEERLGDRGRAIAAYEHAIKEVGDQDDLLVELDRLLLAEQRWEELHNVVERRLALQSSDTDLQTRIAALRHEHLDNPRGALIAYQSVLAQAPDHPGALQGLHELADQKGRQR